LQYPRQARATQQQLGELQPDLLGLTQKFHLVVDDRAVHLLSDVHGTDPAMQRDQRRSRRAASSTSAAGSSSNAAPSLISTPATPTSSSSWMKRRCAPGSWPRPMLVISSISPPLR
jgi:hypothetical protein